MMMQQQNRHQQAEINEKRILDREALRSVIQQWNANRLDLFELSEPDENLQFHGVMRFYFQDTGQKVATKCIRVASDATVQDVIETLIEKFRPDMRMLSVPSYALYEVHSNHEERKLNVDEKPLLVQLNWHIDDREGRFLLRDTAALKNSKLPSQSTEESNFNRKLSKREKKEQKKKEKLLKANSGTVGKTSSLANGFGGGAGRGGEGGDDENHVAEKLYTELPETSFTRSISNPEAVMRRRRQQKLEKKLQQFRSKDGGPDTGGTLKIYGESLCQDVPYKTLLLSIRDCAQAVVREMLAKYGLDKTDPLNYCLVQVNSDGSEYILDDDECPLSILMNHPTSRGSIMFHVRRRPADPQQRRRKKKPLGVSNGNNSGSLEREGPMLVEVTHSGDGGRRVKLSGEPIEVGSANTNTLQMFGPLIQPRHCLISLHEGVCTVTPLHPDALTFVNGHHITQPTILHNGSVVMFGRVASYRFVDLPSDGRYNLALSQSQLDSAYLYESRSPTSPNSWQLEEDRPLSPSVAEGQKKNPRYGDTTDRGAALHHPHQANQQHDNNGLGMSATSMDNTNMLAGHYEQQQSSHHVDSNVDAEGIVDTDAKSISSVKSTGSVGQGKEAIMRNKSQMMMMGGAAPGMGSLNMSAGGGGMIEQQPQQGQEPILPAVLEFPETHQEEFLRHIITDLDVNAPNFKLAPVYTMYLCARYRASTHYRPDLQPTERAHKLTAFLQMVASRTYACVQEQYADPKILSFWMANCSEFLHFLKCDRHISAFSVQAQEILAEAVQVAFRNLVNSFHVDLSQTLNQFLSENIDHDSAAGLVLQVLGGAMALLRRCRVNAALTIQLFSQLFHYINVVCFNKLVTTPQMCNAHWGQVVQERLQLLETWADRQGLELAAECHLAKINQCAEFLQAPKTSVAEVQQLAHSCFRLNSLQMAALISQEQIPKNLVDTAIRMAESVADELTRADGREIRLEESPDLPLALLLPDDGFSCDVVRGIPAGLVDFLMPLQNAGMCRLAAQPTSIGLWTVYMHQYNHRSPSAMSSSVPQPDVQVIKLHKTTTGMGLSIVAAKGAGQERLGIYIKSVVPGGAADTDGRLHAGDQLLRVDGQSLIGITQERAADYLVRTGPVVTLEVAKQGAIYHGLATLLQQPSPVAGRGGPRRMSERGGDATEGRNQPDTTSINSSITGQGGKAEAGGMFAKPPLPSPNTSQHQHLPNSKSTPALHHLGNISASGNKSRSIHNLTAGGSAGVNSGGPMSNHMASSSELHDQGFYQNLSIYRGQNISQPNLGTIQPLGGPQQQHQTQNARPASSYYPNATPGVGMVPPEGSGMNYQMMPDHLQQGSYSSETMGGPHQQQQIVRGPMMVPGGANLNQMLAPSMPNIAHSSGYASNVPASQSMHNVSQTQNYPVHYQPQFPQAQQQQQQQHMRAHAKLTEMGELLKRRQQHQQYQGSQLDIQTGGGQSMSPMMLSPNQSQKSILGQTMPMSPLRQLPPTAPKPTMNRPSMQQQQQPQKKSHEMQHQEQLGSEEQKSPPLPPTSTHPLYKPAGGAGQSKAPPSAASQLNYVASNAEPPKVAFYPTSGGSGAAKPQQASNPWEREEREKEQETRREQIRQWRDQQIAELSSISRTAQQEEQLKTLILERDFERRAQIEEMDDEEQPQKQLSPQMNGNISGPLDTQPKDDNVAHPAPSSMQPKSILKHNNSSAKAPLTPGAGSTMADGSGSGGSLGSPSHSKQASPMKQPPKTASFSDQVISHRHLSFDGTDQVNNNQVLSQLTKEMTHLQMTTTKEEMMYHHQQDRYPEYPPPPPERNSSYVFMSQQQQKFIAQKQQVAENTMNNNNHNTSTGNGYFNSPSSAGGGAGGYANGANNGNMMIPPPANFTMSNLLRGDSKRVSFHEEDNNNGILMQTTGGEGGEMRANAPTGLDLAKIREDPDKFIDETTTMLEMMPQTPDGTSAGDGSQVNWNMTVTQTPGVIGAQEVYRDVRTRRLAEKEKNKEEAAIPEKMSFKEKMKMFCENQTPKDKVKISRAQRDIDAH